MHGLVFYEHKQSCGSTMHYQITATSCLLKVVATCTCILQKCSIHCCVWCCIHVSGCENNADRRDSWGICDLQDTWLVAEWRWGSLFTSIISIITCTSDFLSESREWSCNVTLGTITGLHKPYTHKQNRLCIYIFIVHFTESGKIFTELLKKTSHQYSLIYNSICPLGWIFTLILFYKPRYWPNYQWLSPWANQ